MGEGGGTPLHTKILGGLVLGFLVGVAANMTLGADHPVVAGFSTYVAGPIGKIFLRLLQMVIVPLVLSSVALGVAGLGDVRQVGRLGGKTLGLFLTSTGAAAVVGITLVGLFQPGRALDPAARQELLASFAGEASGKVEASKNAGLGIDILVNLVPQNPVKAAVDGDMLGLITFSLIFGAALTLIKVDRARPVVSVLEGISDVTTKIVEMAMALAPAGVFCLIFGMASKFGFHLLVPLGGYVLIVLGGLLLFSAFALSAFVRLGAGMSPRDFFSRVRPALVTAFSTSSSSATLPTAITVAEQSLGVPPRIAGFVLPLGATMNMNGTALFEGVTVLFLCQVFDVPLSLGQTFVVVGMAVLTAVGAAGVPGGSIPLIVGLLGTLGVPPEGIAIILGVDRLLDMARTTVNVMGDLACTAVVARWEGAWSAVDLPVVGSVAVRDESPGAGPLTGA